MHAEGHISRPTAYASHVLMVAMLVLVQGLQSASIVIVVDEAEEGDKATRDVSNTDTWILTQVIFHWLLS